MTAKLQWIESELQNLKDAGLCNRIRTLSSPQGAWLVVDGKRVLNFCSNNYLGLANHPRILQAARQAMEKYGVGPAAVRTIAGTMDLHLELERRLAEFKGVEAAITFQSGFTANLGAIPALVGKEDAIFSDELNHASIIDGSRLAGAKIIRYAHCNPEDLERVLYEQRANFPRALVITDGVFSMDGDISPLDKICEVSQKYTQKDADRALEILLKYGVNHIDTAPRYGDSEVLIGSWMARHRKDFFLATKTGKRTYQEVREDIHRSLDRLKVDKVDLIQLHGLQHPDEWDTALGPGGALEAAIEARGKGLVRFIGVTGHGWMIAALHARALKRFDFDSVLMPYNYVMHSNDGTGMSSKRW